MKFWHFKKKDDGDFYELFEILFIVKTSEIHRTRKLHKDKAAQFRWRKLDVSLIP